MDNSALGLYSRHGSGSHVGCQTAPSWGGMVGRQFVGRLVFKKVRVEIFKYSFYPLSCGLFSNVNKFMNILQHL